MPATPTRPQGLLLLALLAGCAAHPPDMAAAPSPAVAYDAPAAGVAPTNLDSLAPGDELEDLEASLAAYEQQLASNESRLRAMGVRIAVATPAEAREDRYAPPPPARPGDAPVGAGRSEGAKAKKAERAPSGDAASAPQAEPPSPRPTTTPTPTTKSPSPRPVKPNQTSRSAESEAKNDANADDKDRGRCPELCELADATCDLEAKICDLAARHTSEPRYGEVCRRAEDDCRLAAEACDQCSP